MVSPRHLATTVIYLHYYVLCKCKIDESKRAKLGAHYTGKDDIMLIVQPVLMEPLRREWQTVKQKANQLIKKNQSDQAHAELQQFAAKIGSIRVLDPACGSGNFLYVALQQLLDLQKEVIVMAKRAELAPIELTVSPAQLYGLEINPYAHELAQVTVWIGYIQWRAENGFTEITEPILQPLKNIENRDAILAYDDEGKPVEPEWPGADIVIGNPPFLGIRKMREELDHTYVENLRKLYKGKLTPSVDLVTYWFEKSRALIETNKLKRAGLLATNSIRGGTNRKVLERIKKTGDIFMAWSDLPWVLEGAAVRVSIIGFDRGEDKQRVLDGKTVSVINPDLSGSETLLTSTKQLIENTGLSFQGTAQVGPFEIKESVAKAMLAASDNSDNRPNSDVIKRSINGLDITRKSRQMWTIDFGTDMPLEEAALYRQPFEHVRRYVKPQRDKVRRKNHREKWWLFGEARPGMRKALAPLSRYIVTPWVSKHRIFIWTSTSVNPSLVIVITRDDDYFFGVLHSKLHELWALRQGTSLEDRPRYTTTTTFQTFPFPWSPNQEPTEAEKTHLAAIAEAARDLVEFRQSWLNPEGVGITFSEKMVKKRTLTNLYNALTHYRENYKGKQHNQSQWKTDIKGIISLEDIETLDYIHTQLDQAVLDAYGWPRTLTDEQILERLLALNLERAKQ